MDDEKLIGVVNQSGFPLQIAIENTIKNTESDHGWHILSREDAWKAPEDTAYGFIDLILANRDDETRLVIECKRVQNTAWIFLCPEPSKHDRRHIKVWATYKRQGTLEKLNWDDTTASPYTYEAEFCVVPGQDAKSRPMLERVAAELVTATENFALEDRKYYKETTDYLRFSVPVIVTTAELKICKFAHDKISLSDGELSEAEFESVPYLRFRKQLSNRSVELNYKNRNDYNKISYAKENTIFVVNSTYILDFLQNLVVDER